MKTIKIINGTYGQRANGKLRLVRLGETCRVDDKEAARLVGLKVAAYVEEEPEQIPPTLPPSEPEESGGEPPDPDGSTESKTFSREELEDMTKDSLLKVAAQLGLEANARMNKADILRVIHSALARADEPVLPDLSPEDVVE